jgi:membrane-associated protease RseP (regulator of RpoE activity)
MPFGLGTLGAFISLRSPMPNRKILFDIGLAGPLAGFLVALPLLVAGILFSSVEYVYPSNHLQTLDSLGSSVLIRGAVALFTDIPAGRTMEVHPVYFAAWLGLFLTGINLLPVGQLDGGHAAYALLGRTAHVVAMVIFLALIVAGAFLSPNWFIWAFFIMLGGLRHPPPMNDISDIGLGRKLLFGLTVVLFLLIIVPTPFH